MAFIEICQNRDVIVIKRYDCYTVIKRYDCYYEILLSLRTMLEKLCRIDK